MRAITNLPAFRSLIDRLPDMISLSSRIILTAYCIATPLLGAHIEVLGPEKPTMDDPVVILVTANPSANPRPRLDVENLVLDPVPYSFHSPYIYKNVPIAGSSVTQAVQEVETSGCLYQGLPIAPGQATIGPVHNADGSMLYGERRVITIQAPPSIPFSDPARSIEILTRSGMVPAYVLCELSATQAVVGQQVIATWYLISTLEESYSNSTGNSPMPASTSLAWYELLSESGGSGQPIAAGSQIRKTMLRRIAIILRQPGVLHVPDLDVTIRAPLEPMASLKNLVVMPRLPVFRQIRRRSQSAEIAVAARPPSVDAVGSDLVFYGKQANNEIHLTLSGSGDVRDARAPRFESELGQATHVDVRDDGTDFKRTEYNVTTQHKWSYRVTTTQSVAKLPPLKLTILDSRTGSLRDLEWQPQWVFSEPPAARSHPAPPPKARSLEALRRFGEALRRFGSSYGWIILVAAGVWLLRMVRRLRE